MAVLDPRCSFAELNWGEIIVKRATLALALLSAGTAMNAATAATEATRVGDFSLLDQQGYFHQMSTTTTTRRSRCWFKAARSR